MGRGLSELQKTILRIAYRNRIQRSATGNVTNRGVLIGFYRFPFHPPAADTTSGTPQIFNHQEIDINRYRSASVSVAKAFNRLAGRGLAQREYGHGIILTDEGFRVAETLA